MDDIPLWEIVGVAVFLGLSSIFSGLETALIALSTSRIRQIIDEKGEKARSLQRWLQNQNRILASLLFGNNLVNVGASVFAADIANKYFRNYGIAIAVGGMTFLILLLGEILPKTFAKHNPERVANSMIWLILLLDRLFLPFSYLMMRFSRFVVRLVGGRTTPPLVSESEIEYLINLGKKEGIFEDQKGELLHSVLEFTDISTKEIMIPKTNVVAIEAKTPFKEAFKKIVSSTHSRVPVYKNTLDNIIGVLHVKDLLRISFDNPSKIDLSSLVRDPIFVPETQKISSILKKFQKEHQHMAIVIDEYGNMSGIITFEDILEEIVGEIRDEFDKDSELLIQVKENTYLADASLSIHDLEEHLNITFPENREYESLGGFVISHLGYIPNAGKSFLWNGLNFIIKEREKRRLRKIEIIKMPSLSNEAFKS